MPTFGAPVTRSSVFTGEVYTGANGAVCAGATCGQQRKAINTNKQTAPHFLNTSRERR